MGLEPEALTEEQFESHLYTAGQPDPDLLIRTSGEMRISNFLPVADRLRGDLGHSHSLARVQVPGTFSGGRGLSEEGATIRWVAGARWQAV